MKTKLKTRFDSAQASPGFLLWTASNLLQRLHGAVLKPLGMTPAQFSVLASIVYFSKGHSNLTQAFLCAHTGLEKMFLSDLTKTLVKKNWIAMAPHPQDARAKVLIPTPEGIDQINRAIGPIESLDHQFFANAEDVMRLASDLTRLLQFEDKGRPPRPGP